MSTESAPSQSIHIVLYGSPGAGKLTVGRALAKLTGVKLAHNHLAIDFVTPVFDFGSPPYDRLRDAVRLQMALEATRSGISLVHTFVLLTNDGEDYLRDLCAVVETNGGRIEFVQLSCEVDALKARIDSPERAAMKKVRTLDLLQLYLDQGVLTNRVDGRDSLVIDNTYLPPEAAARQIAEHFGLPILEAA